MNRTHWTRLALAAALGIAAASIAGCREDEQGRMLLYEKGTYKGQPDTSLSPQRIDELRQRAAGQRAA